MANQKLIDEVGKYIEKYYEEPEGKVQSAECQIDACDPDEFDISTMKKEKVKKGMSSTMASNRKIENLMKQMEETFSQILS